MIYTVKGFPIAFQWSKSRCFTGIPLLSQWSSECWQFDLWFLCLFCIQLVYLQVLGSGPAEAWLEGFWTEPYLHVKWAQLYDSLYTLWHFPSLGLEKNLTFSSPVAIAELSKSADKSSATALLVIKPISSLLGWWPWGFALFPAFLIELGWASRDGSLVLHKILKSTE